MNETIINWDEIPDVITKDQLYRICHISKATALYLLQSGKIPCEFTGKRTRCYKIKKQDVITYLKDRAVFPESNSAPDGWYGGHYKAHLPVTMPQAVLEDMHDFFESKLTKFQDVMTVPEIVRLTGYCKTSVNNWCRRGKLKCFKRKGVNLVPKVYLLEFFCSLYFRKIVRKSDWHIRMLREFPRWKRLEPNHPQTQSVKSDKGRLR